VILVTGRSEKEDLINGLTAGADEYLVKPVDPDELFARLATGKRILDLQEQLLTTQHLLKEQATRDALTGLMNRRAVLEALDREWTRCHRECRTLTVIMADIDHFKAINDTHGHVIGDQVLRMTAQRLLSELRPYDSIGRYGGEEFLIILTGCDSDMSLRSAERLRHAVEATLFRTEAIINVTLSLGIATWDGHASAQDLIRVADAALYQAKSQGRNRSAMADPGSFTHGPIDHSPNANSN
jgi:diguanylate cyclase (GGDEF)-like protein